MASRLALPVVREQRLQLSHRCYGKLECAASAGQECEAGTYPASGLVGLGRREDLLAKRFFLIGAFPKSGPHVRQHGSEVRKDVRCCRRLEFVFQHLELRESPVLFHVGLELANGLLTCLES